jgi:hypothetical protein
MKIRNYSAIFLGITSLCINDAQSWPKEGITFKLSDMTLGEEFLKESSYINLLPEDGDQIYLDKEGKDNIRTISDEEYENHKDTKFTVVFYKLKNDNPNYPKAQKPYKCEEYIGIKSLKEFEEKYKDQFDKNKKWAIQISGSDAYINDKKIGKVKSCKVIFFPIL